MQPHGMFAADECFGGRNLNRGIELCAVVSSWASVLCAHGRRHAPLSGTLTHGALLLWCRLSKCIRCNTSSGSPGICPSSTDTNVSSTTLSLGQSHPRRGHTSTFSRPTKSMRCTGSKIMCGKLMAQIQLGLESHPISVLQLLNSTPRLLILLLSSPLFIPPLPSLSSSFPNEARAIRPDVNSFGIHIYKLFPHTPGRLRRRQVAAPPTCSKGGRKW
jgi:hypothetical protein